MKTQYPSKSLIQIQKEIVEIPKFISGFECIYGKHQAEILHRGTAYCRACYDAKNPYRQLIDS